MEEYFKQYFANVAYRQEEGLVLAAGVHARLGGSGDREQR